MQAAGVAIGCAIPVRCGSSRLTYKTRPVPFRGFVDSRMHKEPWYAPVVLAAHRIHHSHIAASSPPRSNLDAAEACVAGVAATYYYLWQHADLLLRSMSWKTIATRSTRPSAVFRFPSTGVGTLRSTVTRHRGDLDVFLRDSSSANIPPREMTVRPGASK